MKKKDKRIPWDQIDTVFLDMDGTLLDNHFEDVFWDELMPKEYAKKNGLSLKESFDKLQELYKKEENTLNWGNIDFWERKTGLDLWKMRQSVTHLIKIHPHTLRFLKFLQKEKKKVYIITSSYDKDMKFKMGIIKLEKYFDGIFNDTNVGVSKRKRGFWKLLEKKVAFDKKRTVFSDDKENVLKAAAGYGIKYLVLKTKFSSKKPAIVSKEFICVDHFDDIIS